MGKANNKPQEKITKAQRTPQNLAAGERLKNMINGSPYNLKAIANLLDLDCTPKTVLLKTLTSSILDVLKP